jgi:hypothetical protein
VGWQRACVVGLIAVRVAILAVTLGGVPPDPSGHYVANDSLRYTAIAQTPGVPYRDFDVEVPPLEEVYLEVVTAPDPHATVVRNAMLQFVFDLLIALVLALGWGGTASLWYLAIGTPIAPFLAFRLDLMSVLLATSALAFARRDRRAPAGILLAAAILTKVWPAVLIPVLAAQRRWRALIWTGAAAVTGMAAWIVWSGWSGPAQVATLRGAAGWQIESIPGSVLLAVTDLPVIFEQDANRIGEATAAIRLLLLLTIVMAVVVVALRARRGGDADDDGLMALVLVTALLVASPIISWQYVAWLLPWTAIVASQARWGTTGLALLVVGLSSALIFQGVPLTARDDLAVALLVGRNVALVALTVTGMAALLARRSTGDPEVRSPTPARAHGPGLPDGA